MKILMLVKHGFGESGGIARYSQDFLNAVTSCGVKVELAVLAQSKKDLNLKNIPGEIQYITVDAQNRVLYLYNALKLLLSKKFDLVFCMHMYLLPVGCLFRLFQGSQLLLWIYGIEAWQAKNKLFYFYLKFVNRVISISGFTLNRFCFWSGLDNRKAGILSPAIDQHVFHQKLTSDHLQSKYGLENKLVIFTLSRLQPGRSKGHEVLIRALPDLLRIHSNLVYLIAGTGEDVDRLQAIANELALEDHVRFTGFVTEEEKVEYYQLSDVFFMAGEGEGFGIVYLEALACGLPVVASKLDASAEVIGELSAGILVSPNSEEEVKEAILKSIKLKKIVPEKLTKYSLKNFNIQVNQLLVELIKTNIL